MFSTFLIKYLCAFQWVTGTSVCRHSHLCLLLVFNASLFCSLLLPLCTWLAFTQLLQPPTIQRPPRRHLSLLCGCYLSVILQTSAWFVRVSGWRIVLCEFNAQNWLFCLTAALRVHTVPNSALSYITWHDFGSLTQDNEHLKSLQTLLQ